jgi:hypothetical protein
MFSNMKFGRLVVFFTSEIMTEGPRGENCPDSLLHCLGGNIGHRHRAS